MDMNDVLERTGMAKARENMKMLSEIAEGIEKMKEKELRVFLGAIKMLKASQEIAQQAPVQQKPVKIVVELKVSQAEGA